MPVTVVKTGPWFVAGEPVRVMTDMAQESEKAVATLGASMVRSRMDRVFRVQTPFYRLKNIANRYMGHWRIWDQDATVYGFWLEGIGSRNRTTRFKGYFTYRIIGQELRTRTPAIVEGVVRRMIGRLR
jgi:hypothetical protein